MPAAPPPPPVERCGVCWAHPFKYKCPRCGVKTCSAACVKSHKVHSGCTGVPDKTHFVGMKGFTIGQLEKDMGLLTDIIDGVNRNSKKYSYNYGENKVDRRFKQLKYICRSKRGCTLRIAPAIFAAYKLNKSYYSKQEDTLYWTVGVTFVTEKSSLVHYLEDPVSEKTSLRDILSRFEDRTKFFSTEINQFLSKYTKPDFDALRVYIKTVKKEEGEIVEPGSKARKELVFCEADKGRSLREELEDAEVTDFPMLFVLFRDVNPRANKTYSQLE